MNQPRLKMYGIALGATALALTIWTFHHFQTAQAQSAISSEVLVTICGDGVAEGNEECDNGKHCANRESCLDDSDCLGIGDGLCIKRRVGSCDENCEIISGGGEPTDIILTEIRAHPEGRFGPAGTNYDTDLYLTIYTSYDEDREVAFQNNTLYSSSSAGVVSLYEVLPLDEGVYDAVIKSEAHLSRLLDNVFMQAGENILNFTNTSNSPTDGSRVLIAGDINGTGNSPSTMGDDVINAVDISILLHNFGSSDPSGSSIRANLNQDNVVNQDDLTLLIGNIDKVGDLASD